MGKSLVPVLDNPAATVRDHIITECVGPPDSRLGVGHRMVRTDHFKCILTGSDEEAFFDLQTDPYEMKNLIAAPELKGEIDRHRAMLKEWSASVGEKRIPLEEVKATKPAREESPSGKRRMHPPAPHPPLKSSSSDLQSPVTLEIRTLTSLEKNL